MYVIPFQIILSELSSEIAKLNASHNTNNTTETILSEGHLYTQFFNNLDTLFGDLYDQCGEATNGICEILEIESVRHFDEWVDCFAIVPEYATPEGLALAIVYMDRLQRMYPALFTVWNFYTLFTACLNIAMKYLMDACNLLGNTHYVQLLNVPMYFYTDVEKAVLQFLDYRLSLPNDVDLLHQLTNVAVMNAGFGPVDDYPSLQYGPDDDDFPEVGATSAPFLVSQTPLQLQQGACLHYPRPPKI